MSAPSVSAMTPSGNGSDGAVPAPRPWWRERLHVVDFEGSLATGVVEYGVVSLDDGRVTGVSKGTCRALRRPRAAETRLHGLRGDEAAEPFARDELYAAFSALRASGTLVAHGASVEHGLLRAAWPYPAAASRVGTSWGPWLDTLVLARRVWPGMKSARLGDLVEGLGLADDLAALSAELVPEGRRRFHAAPHDAVATALVLRAAAAEPGWATPTLAAVLARLGGETGDQQLMD